MLTPYPTLLEAMEAGKLLLPLVKGDGTALNKENLPKTMFYAHKIAGFGLSVTLPFSPDNQPLFGDSPCTDEELASFKQDLVGLQTELDGMELSKFGDVPSGNDSKAKISPETIILIVQLLTPVITALLEWLKNRKKPTV